MTFDASSSGPRPVYVNIWDDDKLHVLTSDYPDDGEPEHVAKVERHGGEFVVNWVGECFDVYATERCGNVDELLECLLSYGSWEMEEYYMNEVREWCRREVVSPAVVDDGCLPDVHEVTESQLDFQGCLW